MEPIEILPGLFLGNASHSEDLKSLKKYNIKVSVRCCVMRSCDGRFGLTN